MHLSGCQASRVSRAVEICKTDLNYESDFRGVNAFVPQVLLVSSSTASPVREVAEYGMVEATAAANPR